MKTKWLQRISGMLAVICLVAGSRWAVHAAGARTAQQATNTFTFNPVADAYVLQSKPNTNFGTSLSLRADSSPITRSYLRFVVGGLNGATVDSVKLRLYANSSSTAGFAVNALANNTWAETTITYTNAPAPESAIANAMSISSGTWVTLDVTSYIQADGTYSFVLTTASTTTIKLSSRHVTNGTAPQLVLTTASPTATPTLGATAAPTFPPTQMPTALPSPTAIASSTATSQPTDWQPTFPIRAAFYYPWFPEAWTQQGIYPYTNYNPILGFYSSKDAATLQQHIAMMQYAGIQAGIASWWGQGSQTDSKIGGLLSAAAGTHFRWALYYENESQGDPSASQIQNDLTYISDHYGKDPNFLRVNGRFVVFVYADANDGCGMADRWKQGNTVGAYIVLKVFSGYLNCASQPDSWHQYSPAVAADRQGNFSYSISPGFWLKGQTVRLSRDVTRWTQNVQDMVASGTAWQLVTTFSEWGEGTAVEPAAEWASSSGYGQYLDVLHYNGNMPSP